MVFAPHWGGAVVTPEQLESVIARIGYGRRYISALDNEDKEHVLIVQPMTPKIRAWIDYIFNLELDRAIKDGLFTESDILKDIGYRGIWTKFDDDTIARLKEELDKIPSSLADISKREERKLDKLRQSIVSQITEMSNRRSNLLSSSAERYAENMRVRAFVYMSVVNENGNKIWNTWHDFNNLTDNKFIDNIIDAVSNKPKDVTIAEIREIARSGQWRHKWLAAKTIDSLFGKSVLDMSDEQTMLVYWSQIYDSVYDAYERPPQEVIDDDLKLDEWLESQSKKTDADIKKTFNEKNNKKRGHVSKAVNRHGEIFITADGGLGPAKHPSLVTDAHLPSKEEISDLNSELNKKFLNAQDRRIRQAGGYINEEDLRSDKDSRRVIGSNDAVVSVKRGGDGRTRKNVDKLLPGGTINGRRV